MLGRVTFQKTCQSLAPSVRAASSSDRSMASKIGISSRTTNGSVTNNVASAMPAIAAPLYFYLAAGSVFSSCCSISAAS